MNHGSATHREYFGIFPSFLCKCVFLHTTEILLFAAWLSSLVGLKQFPMGLTIFL